jgi:hypothetical protein
MAFEGYPRSVDLDLLVALAEGGEPPEVPEYEFGGRREFFRKGPPWYDGYVEPEEPQE